MNTSSRQTEVGITEPAYCLNTYPALFCHALEWIAEMSKTSLDVAVEQNAEVLASCKIAVNVSPMPAVFLLDLAAQALSDCTKLQNSLVDLVAKLSTNVIEVVQLDSHDHGMAAAGCIGDPSIGKSEEINSKTLHRAKRDLRRQSSAIGTQGRKLKGATQLRADTLLAKKIVDLFVMQEPGSTAETVENELQAGQEAATKPVKITDVN